MKASVGVHTFELELCCSREFYEAIKAALPAPIGQRGWYVDIVGGAAVLRRSRYGASFMRLPRTEGIGLDYRLSLAIGDPLYRFGRVEATFRQDGRQFVAELPPLHRRPWIRDQRSRIKRCSIAEQRERLVADVNGRVRSATAALEDMPRNMPDWVRSMLTEREQALAMSNQEI